MCVLNITYFWAEDEIRFYLLAYDSIHYKSVKQKSLNEKKTFIFRNYFMPSLWKSINSRLGGKWRTECLNTLFPLSSGYTWEKRETTYLSNPQTACTFKNTFFIPANNSTIPLF